MKRFFAHLSFSLLVFNIAQASDELCKKSLTIEEFVASAFAASSTLADIDKDLSEQLSRAFEVEVLNNPELQVEHTATNMDVDGANDSQSTISLSQPLRLSDFGKKAKVAALIRNVGDLEKKRSLLEANQKFKLSYYTMAVLQQSKEILEQSEQRAANKVGLIKQGVRKGLFSSGEEKLFEGEKYRLQAQLEELKAKIANLQAEISKDTGISCHLSTKVNLNFEEIPGSKILLKKAEASKLSENSRIKLLENLAEQQNELAQLDAIPQISPRLIYQHTNDGGDFYGVGVSMPLPFWNKNQAQKIKSASEYKTVKINRKNFDLENQINLTRKSAMSLKKRAEIYLEKVIPSFKAALSSQERIYSEGKGNVLEVWQTLTVYNEVQAQGLTLWLEAMLSRIRLSILVGEEI